MSTITKALAAVSVGVALTASLVNPAEAASKATADDRAAIKSANKVCKPVSDDYGFEACVVGAFASRTGRAVLGSDYALSEKGDVVLTRKSRKVSKPNRYAPTRADEMALKSATDEAFYVVPDGSEPVWTYVLTGDFILTRERFIDDGMVAFTGRGEVVLTRHSIRIH